MRDWVSVFSAEGEAREGAANTPLPLDDLASVWLVDCGRVDVFAVFAPPGEPPGARRHLFRVEAGGALFGCGAPDSACPTRLLAVGAIGCRVWRLARERFTELGADAALLDGWVTGLTAGVNGEHAPKGCAFLHAGAEVVFDGPRQAAPAKGVVWVRATGGRLRFLGAEELPGGSGDSWFPLAEPGWLATEGPAVLRAEGTEAALAAPWLWAALGTFGRTIRASASAAAWEAAAAGERRLLRREEADRRAVGVALAGLAAVVDEGQDELAGGGIVDDPLLAACRLLGPRLGVTFRARPGPTAGRDLAERVGRIARASRVRYRPVRLAADWWRQDNGPLLAFREADGGPVALLPTSAIRYELADPAESGRRPVTAPVAASLASGAYSFSPPLPPAPLGAWGLLRFGLRGCGSDMRALFLLGLAGGVLGLAGPIATGVLVDEIIPGAEANRLLLLVLALLAAATAGALFQITRGVAFLRLEGRLSATVQGGLWDRLLGLPAPFFRQFQAGDLADRARGPGAVRHVLADAAASSVVGAAFSLLNLGLLFVYDRWLAGIAGAVAAVVLAVVALVGQRQLRRQREVLRQQGKVAGLVLQLIGGVSRLRVAGAEGRALARWVEEFTGQKRLATMARRLTDGLAAFQAAAPSAATAVLCAAVAWQVGGRISAGAFLAFSAAFAQLLLATLAVSSAVDALSQIVPLFERAGPIVAASPEAAPSRLDPGELRGEIEVSHVSFRYQADGPAILEDVSVHVRPGEFVALVGPSGAGKSTLFRLLLGFQSPQVGTVRLDRKHLAGLDLQEVRRQIGTVLQDGRVVAGDLSTNILGSHPLPIEEAWEAARLSGLDEDIRQMPMGMHTIVPEGGGTLSGGQRQRLLIARAVVSKPRILLFDEATSALDNQTQALVSNSLETLKATRLVAAHRLSTIRHADRIIVLDRGQVVQEGTFEELAGQAGLFAELVKRQLA